MKTANIIAICILAIGLTVAVADIVVNEIMYNSPESGTDNEWVELYNITSATIHLDSTWTLTDGEGTYAFEGIDIAGEGFLTIKLAENDSVPFPFTPDVDASGMGIYLGNGGDQVILVEGTTVVDSVDYDDSWPGWSGHDGGGKSLERINPGGPSNIGANWTASIPEGGTPGSENSVYDTLVDTPPVVDIIQHTPSAPTPDDTVAITAQITDDGTITKAMCFYSVDSGAEDSVSMADDGAHGDGAAGDDIWGALIMPQPVNSTVTYYLVVEDDGFHSDTTWAYAYFVASGDTIDANVIVNEIMYNPASPMSDDYFEFIELYNRGSSSFNISNWIVKDDNDFNSFTIPSGTHLGAHNYLVLARNADSIEAHYGISGVMGSVDFNLNNTGDAVRLYNSLGSLMDYVYFGDSDPWPEAPDGDGSSLELINASSDNNDASNWQASAGDGTPGMANSTGITERGDLPENISLLSISPNPFNPAAKAGFMLPEPSEITLEIYDLSGRMVSSSEGINIPAGYNEIPFSLDGSPAGIYLTRISYGDNILSGKALLIK